jgi:hypothetical protein
VGVILLWVRVFPRESLNPVGAAQPGRRPSAVAVAASLRVLLADARCDARSNMAG